MTSAQDISLSLRLTQALGLTSALLLASGNLSITLIAIPRILESPSPLCLRQWNNLYHQGKAIFPPLSVLASSSWIYLSYAAYNSSSASSLAGLSFVPKWVAYATTAGLMIGIVPYTGAILLPTNKKLLSKVEESSLLQKVEGKDGEAEVTEIGLKREETVHYLVDHWALLNLGRGGMLLAGGLLGMWSVLF